MTNHFSSARVCHSGNPNYFPLLDGLRGVVAIIVVWFHIFEAFATSPLDQMANHGYLAVDFFFLLSGFVVSYSYDRRWSRMNLRDFLSRRLIRLHPMLVLGAILGGLLFYVGGYWSPHLPEVSLGTLLVVTLMNVLLIPLLPSGDVRGWGEIFPLNGPAWSLFYEYLANLAYALGLRRLSLRWLGMLSLCFALALSYYVLTSEWCANGAGWSFAGDGFWGGLWRVLTSFCIGMLLSRVLRPIKVRRTFLFISLTLTLLMFMPRIGGETMRWANGLYELICVLVIFPALLYLGASDASFNVPNPRALCLYKFLGEISYPLYIIHYPFIYIYIAWVRSKGLAFVDTWPWALLIFFGCIALAWLSSRVYDLPLRRYLSGKFSGKAVSL